MEQQLSELSSKFNKIGTIYNDLFKEVKTKREKIPDLHKEEIKSFEDYLKSDEKDKDLLDRFLRAYRNKYDLMKEVERKIIELEQIEKLVFTINNQLRDDR
jgi:tRNA-dihydrouridine synthase